MKKSMSFAALGLGVILGAVALMHYQPWAPAPTRTVADSGTLVLPDQFFVQDLDAQLGESFEDGSFAKEKEYITHVAQTFLKFSRDVHAQSKDPKMFRGAHAKALACLKARLDIQNQNLPEKFRVGLFAENGKQYKGWVRISNSSQNPMSAGADQNTRGFAIKLLGVDGEKLLDPQKNAKTHDLLMVASEAFIAKDDKNYSDIADGTEGTFGIVTRLGIPRLLGLLSAVRAAKAEANPLKLNYFSTVPYRLGSPQGPKAAIKFAISLCGSNDLTKFESAKDGDNYLEKNIAGTINNVDAVCYDLKVQFAGKKDAVEDATTKWATPYVSIGKLWLKHQDNQKEFLAGREPFCESLSFNPWHATALHRPLGRINRARRAAYMASSKYRHQANADVAEEPTEQSFDSVR